MLFTTFFIIASIFQSYEMWLLYRCFFGKSRRGIGSEFLAFFLFFAVTTTLYLFLGIPIVTAIASYGTLVLAALFVYESGWKNGLLYSVFAFVSMTLAECIVGLATGFIDLNIFQSGEYYNVWGMVALPVVQYLVVILIRNFRNLRKGREIPILYWTVTIVLPIFSLYLDLIICQQNFYWLNMLGCTVLLFIMNVLVFYLCDVQIENMRVRFEKEKLEQLNVYQNRQLELMHQMDEELRIQRHDFKKHISMLAFMNSQGEKEKLTEYLNEMQEGELFEAKFEKTGNFVIDSVLSYKTQEANRLGIESKMDVKVPKDLNISAYVLTGILTNLLDNAIEACCKAKQKHIKVVIKYAKKMLIIRISNTYDGKEKFNSVTEIKTSKSDKELHGYGIKSIRHMVESMEGDFTIRTKDEWFVADVAIPLM